MFNLHVRKKCIQIMSRWHYFLTFSFISDAGEDFSSNDLLHIFVRGTLPDSQCISIDIVDDADFEESQNFSVSIMTISPPIATAGEFATVVIQDNNGQN